MSRQTQKVSTSTILAPNISYEDREVRILAGAALILTLMVAAPTPLGLWGLAALVAIPIIASGIIGWDPLYALFGVNHYSQTEGEIQQRSWSCPNVGTVDRIARLGIGALLLATVFDSTEIVWQSTAALLAIPVIMSAIMAWDPLYALAYANTFSNKSDVQSADPDMTESTLAKFYQFHGNVHADPVNPLERAA